MTHTHNGTVRATQGMRCNTLELEPHQEAREKIHFFFVSFIRRVILFVASLFDIVPIQSACMHMHTSGIKKRADPEEFTAQTPKHLFGSALIGLRRGENDSGIWATIKIEYVFFSFWLDFRAEHLITALVCQLKIVISVFEIEP